MLDWDKLRCELCADEVLHGYSQVLRSFYEKESKTIWTRITFDEWMYEDCREPRVKAQKDVEKISEQRLVMNVA